MSLLAPLGNAIHDVAGSVDRVAFVDVVVVAKDGSLAAWSIGDGRRLPGIPPGRVRTGGVFQCGIRGNAVPTIGLAAGFPWAAACHETTVTVWDLELGEPLASFTADSVVEACAFDGNASRIAIGTVSGQMHILGVQ